MTVFNFSAGPAVLPKEVLQRAAAEMLDWHGVGASHLSTGSVFWRNVAPNSRGIDSHANSTRHTLFDAIESRGMRGGSKAWAATSRRNSFTSRSWNEGVAGFLPG